MIKVSFIVAIGLLAVALLRRRGAALRHFVLASALVCSAAMPLLQRVAPAWTPPLGLSWLQPQAGSLTFGDGGTDRHDASLLGTKTGTGARPQASLMPSLGTIWTLGAFISILVLAAGLARIAWIASRSRELTSGPWFDAVRALYGHSPAGPAPRLLQSDHENLLVTWGLRKPTIVVPTFAREWPGDRIRAVVGHEVAHIRRRDWAVQMFAELLKAAYWFNPLMWIACHQLRQTSEEACDDEVLRTGVGATEYAAHLLEVARALRLTPRRSVFPVMAMARPSQLERRVRAMLLTGTRRSSFTRVAGGAAVLTLLVVAFTVAGIANEPARTPEGGAAAVLQSSPVTANAATELAAAPAAGAAGAPREGEEVQTTPAARIVPVLRLTPVERVSAEQLASASFSGSVIDATGRGIADHPIKLVSTASGKPYETRTDGTGRFSITNLPAGEFQVEIQKPGFKRILAGVKLAPGQAGSGEFVMQLGMLSETISVAVDPALAGSAGADRPAPPVTTGRVPDGPAPPDPCDGSVVGGCVTPPRKLVDAKPRYPRNQAGEFVSGKVVVESRLGTDGLLKEFRILGEADPGLAAATTEALRLWRFSQVRLNGVPQECSVTVTVQFTVAGK